jgi:hypothetical protein
MPERQGPEQSNPQPGRTAYPCRLPCQSVRKKPGKRDRHVYYPTISLPVAYRSFWSSCPSPSIRS